MQEVGLGFAAVVLPGALELSLQFGLQLRQFVFQLLAVHAFSQLQRLAIRRFVCFCLFYEVS